MICNHGPLDQTHLPENCDECKRIIGINKMERESALRDLRALKDRQVDEDALWFAPDTPPEAYVQRALVKLHQSLEKYLAFVEPL